MKLSKEELYELTKPDGGRFAVESVNDAYSFCRRLTLSHYENFPVGSLLLPKSKRNHVFAVYSFARVADDIADELFESDVSERLSALTDLNNLISLKEFEYKSVGNPIIIALRNTMKVVGMHELPFQKLIIAFKRDICFCQPGNLEELLDYCFYSANPVGELILRIFGLYNKTTSKFSDKICTGLQLINFWQDFSVDLPRGRNYIPLSIMEKNNLKLNDLLDKKNSANFNLCINELFGFTQKLMDEGTNLLRYLSPFRLRSEISATVRGAQLMLVRERELGSDILNKRPSLSKIDMMGLLLKTFFIG